LDGWKIYSWRIWCDKERRRENLVDEEKMKKTKKKEKIEEKMKKTSSL
jgi:hypothetical protein